MNFFAMTNHKDAFAAVRDGPAMANSIFARREATDRILRQFVR